ncbi:uncharacterized protein LOC117165311 [Bombus vancouverensis nearcticus]|uniref:uncharacterized protein LOC117165311 n=1 Tax=Bombus vancouverensis nearcticus TaxID=2705178 RepID=UPI00402B6275
MLLQRLWTLKIDWDESLPADVHTEWSKYYAQLPLLNNVEFPRKTIINPAAEIELHGFCDASERAYGACVYLRTITLDGHVCTRLLTAKSKVAPLKSLTIPRLELSGALLLASLANTVLQALTINIARTVYWTDSTIVLHWINTSPHTLKTFVANRVTEIQRKTHASDWRHTPTTDNPADLISRGQLPEDFLKTTIWQHGPEWLQQPEEYWPAWNPVPLNETPEQKKATCLSATPADHSILGRFSSWPKLIRIAARCLRWRQARDRGKPLTMHELTNAHNRLIKLLQACYFSDEIRALRTDRNSAVKGKLQRLNPFLDKDGMLRVGGRLSHSPMPFHQKHPIILPKSSVTALIIEHEHLLNLHSGTQATLYALRRSYWPIDGRSQIWSTLKKCVRCCRANPPPVDYIMGDLPAARITESRPFTNVGIDYCGPFYIKERRDRNRRNIKVYVAIFVCLAVKAVHIELVSDLTSEAFISALRRFIARRGFCVTIYSDNGTNFVGVNNELRELRNLLQSDDHKAQVQSFLADRRIEWHFIPPNSPHFGGLWEATVKSFKRHLRRVVVYSVQKELTMIKQEEGQVQNNEERDRSRERDRNRRAERQSRINSTSRDRNLKDLFRTEVGKVAHVELFTDENDKPRGCGIVEFEDSDSVKIAVEKMHRYDIKRRKLVVKEDFDVKWDSGKVFRIRNDWAGRHIGPGRLDLGCRNSLDKENGYQNGRRCVSTEHRGKTEPPPSPPDRMRARVRLGFLCQS